MVRHNQQPNEDTGAGHPHLREVGAEPLDEEASVAAELIRARQARGIDLPDAARELRIRLEYITALEEQRFDDLPGGPYAIGFLRSYATYLGLDGENIIARFKTETSGFSSRQKLDFPSPADEGRAPSWWLLVLALALAVAVYAGWYYLNASDRVAINEVSEVPENLLANVPPPAAAPTPSTAPTPSLVPLASEVAAVPPGEPTAAPEPAIEAAPPLATTTESMTTTGSIIETTRLAAPEIETTRLAPPETPATDAAAPARGPRVFGQADAGSRILIRATAESWVRVTGPDNELLLERSLNPGDVYHVPDRPGLKLTTGNAGVLEVIVDGRIAPPLGPFGAVRRNLALDSESLLAGAAPAR